MDNKNDSSLKQYKSLIQALENCSDEEEVIRLLQNPLYNNYKDKKLLILLLSNAVLYANSTEPEDAESNIEAKRYTKLTLQVAKAMEYSVPQELDELTKSHYKGYKESLDKDRVTVISKLKERLEKLKIESETDSLPYIQEPIQRQIHSEPKIDYSSTSANEVSKLEQLNKVFYSGVYRSIVNKYSQLSVQPGKKQVLSDRKPKKRKKRK